MISPFDMRRGAAGFGHGSGDLFSLGKNRNRILFLTRCPADDPRAGLRAL